MHYVYRLQSLKHPEESFIGVTGHVKKRLAMHNRGKTPETAENGPWRISFYAAFTRKERAKEFERFLKTSKGNAFGKTYLWNPSTSSSSSQGAEGVSFVPPGL